MDTINTIEFREEASQEDVSFNVEETNEQNSVDSVESMEGNTCEEEETGDCAEEGDAAQEDEDCEDLDMEQVPIGVDKIRCERRNKTCEGEQLVFTNPETDLPVQTINELDSQDLDDENDTSFHPENQPESPSRAEDEACEDSERESVDGEDLDGVMMKVGTGDNNKLVFPDQVIEEDTNEEEPSVTVNEKEYVEEEDADFNPAYCGETLSDCEEDNDADEQITQPEVIHLADNACIMKVDPMMIPPPEDNDEEPMVEAEAPMDCE